MSTTERAAAAGGPPPNPPTPEDAGANRFGIAPWVFWPSLAVVGAFVLFTLIFTDAATAAFDAVQSTIVGGIGWYYVLLIAAFVAFSLWVGIGRYGSIKLGKDDDEPEFKLPVWFAMLFATGMGIGLVFWGVAEPLNHFASPRPSVSGTPPELAQQALTQSYIHWGVHAWAIYVVAGLGIGYAVHRKGRPVSIRWALEPLLGDRVKGGLGHAIDVIAVVGTIFGVATSLGLGVSQIGAGFEFLGVFEANNFWLVVLVVIITGIATVSVVSGLDKGIKILSNSNMVLAAVVLVAVLLAGPTLFLLREFVQSIGAYLQDVLQLTFNVSAYQGEEGQAWQAAWTTYYWGWWMSWAPFVGVFIARISKGRTVREFVAGVLLVPTIVTFLWFAVLGGTALYAQVFGDGGYVGADGSVDTNTTLFTLLSSIPGGVIWVVAGILLITIFFVTSSDSGSLVVDMLASGGDPNPPTWSRVLFATLEGLVAIALLLAGAGTLLALQTAAIVTALPFSFVLIGIMLSLARAFKGEIELRRRLMRQVERRELAQEATEQVFGQLEEYPLDAHTANGNGATNGRREGGVKVLRRRRREATK
ncbi:BCCT family transporter [Pseudokineococcus marinus]|uniref:BCCT family transporter n=1 Tax=Pseudokineococcus marinus TaxID=351215 RepID=A0A849BLQ4_9ACTN|nr:BCCT family transporter [Pseudokineococcus marinus]NNH21997.1 BCCT family transporter [Pseudokineococcus marinus]